MILFAGIALGVLVAGAALMVLIACTFLMAAIPGCLFVVNLLRFRAPALHTGSDTASVAVLIPARNEEANVAAALACVLASRDVALQVRVYDDGSTDGTAAIVHGFAERDARVRLLAGSTLPQGWNGKQHACFRLAESSQAPLLLFLDADLRIEPDAIARCVAEQKRGGVALLSGFPRLVTETRMEWLLLPLIQFVLLGFLPMGRMRRTTKPAYAAGCGQFMLAEREAYFACGGHAAIRETKHDGLRLPRLFREHGLRTDICDLTGLASVRMYSSAAEVWNGLAKNATEGLGAPRRIVPLTILLFVGQVLPLPLTAVWLLVLMIAAAGAHMSGARPWTPWLAATTICVVLTVVMSFLPRLLATWRFRQPLKSALLHPLGIVLLLGVQWYALVRMVLRKPVGWRGRA